MVSHSRASRIAALALVISSLVASATAQDNLWIGGVSYWDLASNWSLGLPTVGQRLFIGYDPYGFSGGTTFRSGTVSVGSLFSRNALNVSGGSLSLTSTVESSTIDGALNVSGGTLGGGANLTVGGLTTLTGGVLGGSGKATANGGVAITSGTVRIADARTLENRGAATWSGGTVNADAGATFRNAAGSTFTANSTGFFGTTWTGGNLVNDGTLTHSTGTTTFSGVALSGTGSIVSTGGELRFVDAQGVDTLGSVKASGFGQVTFQGGVHDVTLSSLATSGNGRITFANATLEGGTWAPWTLPATSTVGSIRIQDSMLRVGSIVNSDRLAFSGTNTLDGVTGDKGLRFGAYSTETIKNGFNPGGEVTLDYGARMAFVGDRTVNFVVRGQEGQYNPYSGIVMPAGTRLTVGASGVLGGTGIAVSADGAAFDFRNEGSLSATMGFNVDVAGGSLANAGQIVASGGIAENGGSNLRVGAGSFANTGTVRADGGALSIRAASGASFTNTGTIEAINGGSVGVLWAPGTTESGAVRWSNAGLLRADGEGSRLFLGGTFRAADLGSLSVTNGARALVTGTLDNTDRTLTLSRPGEWALFSGGRILGGNLVGSSNLVLDSRYAANVLENVNLDGGLNLGDDLGWVRLVGSTHLNGATTGSGEIDFTDNVTVDHDIVGHVALGMAKEGGVITIASGSTYEGNVDFSGPDSYAGANVVNNGTIRGTASGYSTANLTNHGLFEQAADTLVLYNRTGLVNDGTVRVSGTGKIYVGGNGPIRNSGLMEATNGGILWFDSYASASALTNTGVIRASGVGSEIQLDFDKAFSLADLGDMRATDGAYLSVAGSGKLDLQGGTLVVGRAGRGLWSVDAGGTIYGGNIVNSELLRLTSKLNTQYLREVSVDHGLNVVGGKVSVEGAFRSGGVTTVSGGGNVAFELSRPVDSVIRYVGTGGDYGTINVKPYSDALGLTIAPTGEIATHTGSITPGYREASLVNQGALIANGPVDPTGAGFSVSGQLDNRGTLRATQGGLLKVGGEYEGKLVNFSNGVLTGGSYRADANSRIQVYSLDIHENAANVVLDGVGSSLEDTNGNDALRNLTLNSGGLTISGGRGLSLGQALKNSGTLNIAPGSTFAVGGAFTQTATGRLSMGLGTSGMGLLSVAGNVALDGALNVSILSGTVPTLGSRYTFLTYTGTLSGSLAVDPTRYSLVYGPGSVALQVNAVPEPASLLAVAAGGFVLARRRRR